jgi:predicted RNA-binding protein with PUA-like domain
MTQRYWLMKAEPAEASIDDVLAMPNATVAWTGVRNYQARNFMRDGMQLGDGVLFYHSSCADPGIVGIARVASGARVDPTQFDPASPYFDTASKPEAPRWLLVDVQVLCKTRNFTLPQLRADVELAELQVLKKGNRLSITPVEERLWLHILHTLRVRDFSHHPSSNNDKPLLIS